MDKQILYVSLQGRIGNQLFIYATAKQIKQMYMPNAIIIIDDSEVQRLKWENSLVHYNLPDVEFVHYKDYKRFPELRILSGLRRIFIHLAMKKDYISRYKFECKWQALLNKCGLLLCENGYIPYTIHDRKMFYMEGFFQSEQYFSKCSYDLKNELCPASFQNSINRYPNIDKIMNRNTVCISVKVEHNVGSNMYAVCGIDYWEKAIAYVLENVENPYFFICSDNVQYVLEKLINTQKYEYTIQSPDFPTHISLSVMSKCKHFIIGNTTFGWWAQYLSDNKDKIVCVPSKWMLVDMPIDIYQNHMIKINV